MLWEGSVGLTSFGGYALGGFGGADQFWRICSGSLSENVIMTHDGMVQVHCPTFKCGTGSQRKLHLHVVLGARRCRDDPVICRASATPK
jgi:hypothetical protein